MRTVRGHWASAEPRCGESVVAPISLVMYFAPIVLRSQGTGWEFYWTVVAENQGSKAVMQRILLIINQVVQVKWASSHGGSHWRTKRKMEEKPERGQTFGSQSRRKRGWWWKFQSWSPLRLTWDEVWPWGWDGASVKATEINKVKEWGSNDAEGTIWLPLRSVVMMEKVRWKERHWARTSLQ